MKHLSTFQGVFQRWLRFFLLVLFFFVCIRVFLIDAYSIPTSSMENTLLVGDFLLVNKAVFGVRVPGTKYVLPAFRDPERGEVIVFRPPHDPQRSYVKRVVGLPGDTLEMREKVLFLNGEVLDEAYARYIDEEGDAVHPGMAWQSTHLVAGNPAEGYAPSRDRWGPLVVDPDSYFVLGDNRDNSEDSRYWGFVGRDEIRGSPWLVYFSLRKEAEGAGPLGRVRWARMGHLIQ